MRFLRHDRDSKRVGFTDAGSRNFFSAQIKRLIINIGWSHEAVSCHFGEIYPKYHGAKQ